MIVGQNIYYSARKPLESQQIEVGRLMRLYISPGYGELAVFFDSAGLLRRAIQIIDMPIVILDMDCGRTRAERATIIVVPLLVNILYVVYE